MNSKKKEIFLLVVLILILLAINYSFLDRTLKNFLIEKEVVFVERVIDGDTIVSGNSSIRLLGINSPERGEMYYDEAKVFLEELILNETVDLQYGKERYDKYDRTLAYIFFKNQNINLELVKNGFANFYFPSGKDINYNDFKNGWEECIDNNLNLCENSIDKCSQCIESRELSVDNQRVILYNSCSFECVLTDWNIKDEGRKIFVFPEFILNPKNSIEIKVGEGPDSENILYWKEDYVWTKTGDTLFLRDKEGKLVLWENY